MRRKVKLPLKLQEFNLVSWKLLLVEIYISRIRGKSFRKNYFSLTID